MNNKKYYYSIILVLSLLLFTGCQMLNISKASQNSKNDKSTTLEGIEENYYQEGIRLVKLYSSEDVINKGYLESTQLDADTFANNQQERIDSIIRILDEYITRAKTNNEKIFAKKISEIIKYYPIISLFMAMKEALPESVEISSKVINGFYTSTDKLINARTINDINEINFKEEFGSYFNY